MKSNIRLNRVILAGLPKIYGLDKYEGATAFDIFSSGEVIHTVAQSRHLLGIGDDVDGADYPKVLSAALATGNTAAKEIAMDLGRRLGIILWVMKTASSATREANSWYDDGEWLAWINARKIFLTGGLASPCLGDELAKYAMELLQELGVKDMEVIPGKYPSQAPLIAAARFNKEDCSSSLVLDFGHTFVKAGVAMYDGDRVTGIRPLEKVPSRFMGKGYSSADEELLEAKELHGFIADVIEGHYRANLCDGFSHHVVISIANNVENGRIGRGGCYYKLQLLGDVYRDVLMMELSHRLGHDVDVTLLHDGYAAAMCFAGEQDAIQIALGTAFGVGFPEELPWLKKVDIEEYGPTNIKSPSCKFYARV